VSASIEFCRRKTTVEFGIAVSRSDVIEQFVADVKILRGSNTYNKLLSSSSG